MDKPDFIPIGYPQNECYPLNVHKVAQMWITKIGFSAGFPTIHNKGVYKRVLIIRQLRKFSKGMWITVFGLAIVRD